MGLVFDVEPNLIFMPFTRRGLRGHLYEVLQCTSHHQRRVSAFSVRVVKYLIKLPASVVTAPSVPIFKTGLKNVGTKDFLIFLIN